MLEALCARAHIKSAQMHRQGTRKIFAHHTTLFRTEWKGTPPLINSFRDINEIHTKSNLEHWLYICWNTLAVDFLCATVQPNRLLLSAGDCPGRVKTTTRWCLFSVLHPTDLVHPQASQDNYELMLVVNTLLKSNLLWLQLPKSRSLIYILWYNTNVDYSPDSDRSSRPWRAGLGLLVSPWSLVSALMCKSWAANLVLVRSLTVRLVLPHQPLTCRVLARWFLSALASAQSRSVCAAQRRSQDCVYFVSESKCRQCRCSSSIQPQGVLSGPLWSGAAFEYPPGTAFGASVDQPGRRYWSLTSSSVTCRMRAGWWSRFLAAAGCSLSLLQFAGARKSDHCWWLSMPKTGLTLTLPSNVAQCS